MLYMLDTDTSSYIIRGGYSAVDRHLAATHPTERCISVITRAELMYGLKGLPAMHHLKTIVPRFLKVTRQLAWNAEAADFHAELRYQLRTSGTPIGDTDALIAAHALAAEAVLVTNNTRHFEKVRLPLMLEDWMR